MNQRTPATGNRRGFYSSAGEDRIPIWISTSNYYFIVLFIAAGLFLAVWSTLHDGFDDTPWMLAAVAAGGFALSLIFFREVILRRARTRALAARRLSRQLQSTVRESRDEGWETKLTIQRNSELLREIQTKSNAAKVLGKLAEAHEEVFTLCEEYLAIATTELPRARPGSPRIPALRKGAALASRRHRFHMLKWAEIKSRSFISEANVAGRLGDKIEAAEDALTAVERAIDSYPDELALVDSRDVLSVFLGSARIKNSIEKAERAETKGNVQRALGHYRTALADLENYGAEFAEREAIYAKIKSEIGRISKLANI